MATNKRLEPTLLILRAGGLAPAFEAVYAVDSVTPPYVDKVAMAAACIKTHGLQPPTTLVVGDSDEDRAMADAHGLSFAAAAWGYGNAAAAGHLSETGHRPMYSVLASMRDLTSLVGAPGESGRKP